MAVKSALDAYKQSPSVISKLLFLYVNPIFTVVRKSSGLDLGDVPVHTDELRTANLYEIFRAAREPSKGNPSPSMFQAISRGNWPRFLWTGLGYAIVQAASLSGPLLLQRIVAGLTCRADSDPPPAECPSKQALYWIASGLFVAPIIQSFVESQNMYELEVLGVRMRNTLMAAIFRKCLKLNNSALAGQTTGKIVTLMSNDAQKLQEVTLMIHAIWGSPIYIMVIVALLYQQISWSSFVGVAVMLLLTPLTAQVGKSLGQLRRQILQWTDQRTTIMTQVINGIRVIKFYGWGTPFRDEAGRLREEEAKILRKIAVLQGAFSLTLFAGPVIVGVVSFAVYLSVGNVLTAATLYTSLALFTLLRFPMGFLPNIILSCVNAFVALKRIKAFLDLPEVGEESGWYKTDVAVGVVRITDGDFTWQEAATEETTKATTAEEAAKEADTAAPRPAGDAAAPTEDPAAITSEAAAGSPALTLRDLNLDCAPGTLTMIVGSVGSGKSSVLATLLRQITQVRGTVSVGGRLAFVPQSAWIMNETVRENVLMGLPMDEARYRHALTAAQLSADLELFAQGDLTEIGERGVTLSGGQKQRVSIARAVYADADVYILDDPLSAVDSHVGKALFEDCIRGALKSKTILLVTNALYFLHTADQVLWLKDGAVRAAGSYAQVAADPEFEKLVGNHIVAEAVESDDGAGEEGTHGKKTGLSGAATLSIAKTTNGLTGKEERAAGAVGSQVFTRYVLAAGGLIWLVVVVLMYGVEQGLKILTDAWLGFYTREPPLFPDQSIGFWLGMHAGLAGLFALVTYVRALYYTFGLVRSAVNLHIELIEHLLRLPIAFFDTNPSGRIINRFSRDTEIMDVVLPQSLIQLGALASNYLGIMVVVSIATPYILVLLFGVTVVYVFLQRYYIPAARELQRLEAVTRSPIYSAFAEAVNGITTIRAYNRQDHFVQLEDKLVEENGLVYATQRAGAAWLSIRLDLIGLFVLTAAAMLAIGTDIDPSLAGLALTYALDLTKFLKFGTRVASKAESDFNSVERIVQYLDEGVEPPARLDGDPDPGTWPPKGRIVVEKAVLRYRPGLPTVLKDVSFQIEPEEHVGIVGRTGSGKSSLFLAFFRMVEVEGGRICIDGIDIATLGVDVLRRAMTLIPQDPFMFTGTVRTNLDPFHNHTDIQLWTALERVKLKETISSMDLQLATLVTDNGGNFSQGQRQLFCLARALLRNNKILMMDEATASVDLDTDALIQKTIRSSFHGCTVLTIAHRLNTIMDSDKVLVMDAGKAAEFDSPDRLLQEEASIFSSLVNNTGPTAAAKLRQIAAESAAKVGRQRSPSDGGPEPMDSVDSPVASEEGRSIGYLLRLPTGDRSPLQADVQPAAAEQATGEATAQVRR